VAKLTASSIRARKGSGEKIVVVTAYDFPGAACADAAGIDAILVGDSLGMAVMGYEDTLAVTMDDMIHHARMVRRGAPRPLLIGDMPFLSYQTGASDAVRNAGRFVAEAGMDAVKLEGSAEKTGPALAAILSAGIPVMGHVGLTPQSVRQFGGFRVQGRAAADRSRILEEAIGLEAVGCFSLVLECIPADLATEITARLSIPTIGIGAGAGCDGQVLVFHDLLGWGRTRFAKTYVDVRGLQTDAIRRYAEEVRTGAFPAAEHAYER
jgi:3-methyl-2-oxobutanoate hydroxymethyltransferase